ncbi:hypothetical protein DSECCO2_328320 [anaerobic digester metagenome]
MVVKSAFHAQITKAFAALGSPVTAVLSSALADADADADAELPEETAAEGAAPPPFPQAARLRSIIIERSAARTFFILIPPYPNLFPNMCRMVCAGRLSTRPLRAENMDYSCFTEPPISSSPGINSWRGRWVRDCSMASMSMRAAWLPRRSVS